jgi:hypothetical protein
LYGPAVPATTPAGARSVRPDRLDRIDPRGAQGGTEARPCACQADHNHGRPQANGSGGDTPYERLRIAYNGVDAQDRENKGDRGRSGQAGVNRRSATDRDTMVESPCCPMGTCGSMPAIARGIVDASGGVA